MKLIEYQDWKIQIQRSLSDLATIAIERGEQLRTYELEAESSEESPTISMGEVLQDSAVRLDSQFCLAVVGHFCRGKSTLINAMLDRTLLTGDLRPNTATSTILHYGSPERFCVTFKPGLGRQPLKYVAKSQDDLSNALTAFTSDAAVAMDETIDANDPEQRLDEQKYIDLMLGNEKSLAEQIDQVEVWCDSRFLYENNVDIIDTPGLGSVFKEHKKATLRILPKADATLFVIQPDPGISKREAAFIELIKEQISNIFFVVTKADQLKPDEIPDVLDFIRSVIKEKVELPVQHIYPVSALKALQGNPGKSGFAPFLAALQEFLLSNSGSTRLLNAVHLGQLYCNEILPRIVQDTVAQNQSIEQLRQEREQLQQSTSRIKQQKQALIATIESRTGEICSNALYGLESLPQKIRESVEKRIATLDLQQLKDADDYLQPVMKDTVVKWLRENQNKFERQMQLLRDRTKQEVKEMLGDIQTAQEQQLFDRTFDFALSTPIKTSNLISVSLSEDIVKMLASIGITGVIATIVGGLIDLGAQAMRGIQGVLGNLFGRSQNRRQQDDRLQRARIQVIQALDDDPFGKNAYQIMIEGSNSNPPITGIREVIEKYFKDWGQQFQTQINDLINNSVNTKLTQLDRQIQELVAATTEKDAIDRLEKYRRQQHQLETLQAQFEQFEKILQTTLDAQN
jgi:GTP-binding protein EngB required for normal cell division